MGWLFGWSSKKDLVDHLVRQDGGNCAVIDHSLRGNNLWLLCQRKDSGFKFIVLCKLKYAKGAGPWDHEWGYKDIDESMGPCELDCPEKFLAQSDDTSPYGTAWRESCRRWRRERAKRLKFVNGLKPGDTFRYGSKTVVFTRPLSRSKNYICGTYMGAEYKFRKAQVQPPEETA